MNSKQSANILLRDANLNHFLITINGMVKHSIPWDMLPTTESSWSFTRDKGFDGQDNDPESCKILIKLGIW